MREIRELQVDVPLGGLSLQQLAGTQYQGVFLVQENAGAARRPGYNAQLAAYFSLPRGCRISVLVYQMDDAYLVKSYATMAGAWVFGVQERVHTWMEALAMARAEIGRLESLARGVAEFMDGLMEAGSWQPAVA